MSKQMEKSWVALHRRPVHSIPVHAHYEAWLSALVNFDSLPAGVNIPPTIVMTHSGAQLYYSRGTDLLRKNLPSFTAVESICSSFNRENPSDIIATWYSDIPDAKGVLVAAEHFTSTELQSFLKLGERKKLGVIQQFVYPLPLRDLASNNYEILHHWNASDEAFVERRIGKVKLDAPSATTLRVNVHPPIQTAGKLSTMRLPFSPKEHRGTSEFVNPGSNFEHFLSILNDHIISALESSRKTCKGYYSRGVTAVTLQCKYQGLLSDSAPNGNFFLCGLVNLRFPPDHSNPDQSFDLFPPVALDDDSFFKNAMDDFPVAQQGYQGPSFIRALSPKKPATDHAAGDTEDTSDSPKRSNAYNCPNCGKFSDATDAHAVTYGEILAVAQHRGKHNHHHLDTLIPQAREREFDGSRQPGKRPRSARVAASTEGIKAINSDAACFLPGTEWTRVPPILSQLRADLDELSHRSVWTSRVVHLCNTCVKEFCQPIAKDQSQPTKPEVQAAKVEQPPGVCNSEVIDQLVFTNLQKQHQKLRRAERDKYEMRQIIYSVRAGSPDNRAEERDRLYGEQLLCQLETVSGSEKAPVNGGTPDVPLFMMLCNELYLAMQSQCNEKIDPTIEPSMEVKISPKYKEPFPQPMVHVDPRGIEDPELKYKRTLHSGVHVARKHCDAALCKTTTAFAEMSSEERLLLVEVAGANGILEGDGDDGDERN